jgi:hypothetical protein
MGGQGISARATPMQITKQTSEAKARPAFIFHLGSLIFQQQWSMDRFRS